MDVYNRFYPKVNSPTSLGGDEKNKKTIRHIIQKTRLYQNISSILGTANSSNDLFIQ